MLIKINNMFLNLKRIYGLQVNNDSFIIYTRNKTHCFDQVIDNSIYNKISNEFVKNQNPFILFSNKKLLLLIDKIEICEHMQHTINISTIYNHNITVTYNDNKSLEYDLNIFNKLLENK